MTDFFRFPHTPHIAWLAQGEPRDDKVLSSHEATEMLSADVVVEEKLDGANLGFSLSPDGELRAQNRGQYLHAPHAGQFARLPDWLAVHGDKLRTELALHMQSNLMLFGEWCAARHSLDYDRLPDWFLLFDVYDRTQGRFWNTARRNALAATLSLSTVPQLQQGKFTLQQLKDLLICQHSQFRQGALEGVMIRRESADWCEARAKLVRPDFTQAIAEHWSRRRMEWNRLDWTHANLN
ncbi:RNA ligase family protein [Rhodoferax sp.]|uniref:RNA ligase family protein n=1 Tax=Rhodoferax sp. TaxID=50421 RepID=UPI0026145E4E|nr:RNA ligase family protein [Rhodoferax sp.]MDD2927133.1 RNA ligase family protein [Rhodoferax sp.]